MIFFDRTVLSIVAGCRKCGCREVFGSQAAADRWAADHIYRSHPDSSTERVRSITAARVRRHRRGE